MQRIRLVSRECGTLVLHSEKKECGHRRQRLLMDSESGQRPRFASSHRIPSPKFGSRAGCSGWKARHRTSLAVQQQRFDQSTAMLTT